MNSTGSGYAFRLLPWLCAAVMGVGLGACARITETAQTLPSPAAGGNQQTEAIANLTPQQPTLTQPGGFGFPAPASLHAQLDAQRQATYIYEDLSKRGDEYDLGLPSRNITSSVGQLTFAPDWVDSTHSAVTDLAYAMYAFQLEGYDLSGALSARWQVPPAAAGAAWIGFGNVVLDRWEWFALDAESMVLTPGFADYIAAGSDRMLVAVVTLGTKPMVLNRLSLGSGISGVIVDTQGTPIGGAQVRLEGLAAVTTDYKGEFSIWGLAETDHLVANFTAENYMDNTQVYEVVGGRQRFRRITLLERAAPAAFNAVDGGELTFPGPLGGSLTLPPGALVDHNDAPLTGATVAYLTFLDVTDPVQFAAAPGDFTARQLDDTDEVLESFGMCEIHIADGLGGEAQLATGQTAQLKLPIPTSQQAGAPAGMGLYSFDQAECKWIEEGAFIKDGTGQYYEAEISHFSNWNADRPQDLTCIRIHVVDSHNQNSVGAVVTVFGEGFASGASAFTGLDGFACLNVSHNSNALVWAYKGGAASEIETISTPPSVMRCSAMPSACLYVKKLTLRDAPVAKLEADVTSGPQPLAVVFDASASTAGGGTITQYDWDFDGQAGGYVWTSTGADPAATHTYPSPGEYHATLRVTDDNGLSSMAVLLISVGGATARGDWWMAGHDPRRTFCSNYTGPQTNHLAYTGASTDDFVIEGGLALAADGTLYAGDIANYLYAFDTADGGLNWKSALMGDRMQSTPAIAHDGTIFACNFDSKLYAFNPADGSIAWSYGLTSGHEDPVLGPDGTVYCSTFGLTAVNPADHTRRWLQLDVLTNNSVAQGLDGTLYAPQQDGRLAAFNPASGECIWQSLDVGIIYTAPAVGRDGTVYIAGSNESGSGALFAFLPGGALKWTALTDGDRVTGEGPAIGPDGNLYVCDTYSGIAYSFGQATGSRRWKSDHSPGYYYSCNPAIGADGILYLGAGDNKVHALDPGSGTDRWASAVLDSYVNSTPAIDANSTLYVISQEGVLYAFHD